VTESRKEQLGIAAAQRVPSRLGVKVAAQVVHLTEEDVEFQVQDWQLVTDEQATHTPAVLAV
jgi:hypothetical protein